MQEHRSKAKCHVILKNINDINCLYIPIYTPASAGISSQIVLFHGYSTGIWMYRSIYGKHWRSSKNIFLQGTTAPLKQCCQRSWEVPK